MKQTAVETVRDTSQDEPSPPWLTWVIFGLFGIGMVIIFLNYTKLLGGEVNNGFTLLGLAFFLAGIIGLTRLR